LDHLTSPGLAYSQILLARIYEPLVLVNIVISWIRLADLNPCTICTMYISFNYLSFQIWYCVLFSLIFHSSGHCKVKKNICVFMVTCQKNLGSVGIKKSFFFFLLSAKPEIVVSDSGISFSKFPVSRHLLKLFYDENTQFFYLLCSQFRRKASSWINKTLLLIKQHITCINISRYVNIDKFVSIRYIFLLARRHTADYFS
jgi:hypothetical protein